MSDLHDGWNVVTPRTRIRLANGSPIQVETTAYDLDAALDRAAQFFGEPIERTGPWLTEDGRNPENEDTGNNSRVTCDVNGMACTHDEEDE